MAEFYPVRGETISNAAFPSIYILRVKDESGRHIVGTIRLYFPESLHPNYSGARVPLTYSEMASMFLKTGRWSGWMKSIAGDLERPPATYISTVMQLAVSEEVLRAEKEWKSAFKNKNVKNAIAKAKSEISEARNIISKHKEKRDKLKAKMAELKPLMHGMNPQTEEQYASTKRQLREVQMKIKTLNRELRQMREKLDEYKTQKGMDALSKETNTLIDYEREFFITIQDKFDAGEIDRKQYLNMIDMAKYSIEALSRPAHIVKSISRALPKMAKILRDAFVDLITGSIWPSISEKTRANRMSLARRGVNIISFDSPLYATGAFVNSVRTEVV